MPMICSAELTLDRLKSLLDYDPITGIFRWRVPRGGARAGQAAGSSDSLGYLQIGIDGRVYMAHRLAWFYVHGKWPTEELDHENRARSKNDIRNLREASHAENARNRGRPKHNSSGYKGVSYYKRDKKWVARIKYQNRSRYLGHFDSPEAAAEFYELAAVMLFGEFA